VDWKLLTTTLNVYLLFAVTPSNSVPVRRSLPEEAAAAEVAAAAADVAAAAADVAAAAADVAAVLDADSPHPASMEQTIAALRTLAKTCFFI
jgi:hypothetical protein